MPRRKPWGLIFWPTTPSLPSNQRSQRRSCRPSPRPPSWQAPSWRVPCCGLAALGAACAGCARRCALGAAFPRRPALHDHRDVAGALADPVRTPLGARTDALGGRALVGVDGGDHQSRRVEPVVVLRVGRRTGDDLGDGLARALRRPAQDVERLGHGLAAHQVDHPACLGRRDVHEACLRRRRRIFGNSGGHRRLLFRSSLM